MILGLDASSTVCGWCVLNNNGTVRDAGFVRFNSKDSLYQRLRQLKSSLQTLLFGHFAVTVYIEEPKKMFGNKSTAHVMSLLQRWNGMVSAMVAESFSDPILINEKSARKKIGVHVPAKCKNAKLVVMQYVQEQEVLPDHVWEYKKTGKIKDHCFDIVDAYVVARAGFLNATTAFS